MFSTGVGGWLPVFVHRNNWTALLGLIGLWAGIQIFMHLRARQARGVFIDEEIELFSWPGMGGFLAGLLLVSTYLVVFA